MPLHRFWPRRMGRVPAAGFANPAVMVSQAPSGAPQTPATNKADPSWRHFEAIGSPRRVVAPMVDGSELPFRMLARKHGAELAYSPMIHAQLFSSTEKYRQDNFSTCPEDRPLAVQFCANDPDTLLKAARFVEHQCDAVDLNLGCPQRIARKGHYGAFLQDEWDLIASMVSTLHQNLSVPVWCKIRIFNDVDKTVAYAKMIQDAGCQLLAVHGRTREQKGHNMGLADWDTIAAVKRALRIPVYANGNVRSLADAEACMAYTHCDGVLSADPLLVNPRLWSGEVNPPPFEVAREYLDMVDKYPIKPGMARGHLFKILQEPLKGKGDWCQRLVNLFTIDDFREFVAQLESLVDEEKLGVPTPSDEPATELKI